MEHALADYYDAGLRLAWLLLGDRELAEDAVGEALARTWRRARRGGIDNPRASLRQAIANESRSRIRRLVRERRARERRDGNDRGGRAADEQVADADALGRALQRLPARQRTAVVLFYYEDFPQEEIARVMGCAVGTVNSSVSRGLERLRTELGEVG
ncbi:sigma-70 family RNA polymerase sigma factor [Egibacter rhizosphaerae]|uniref:sigma-70 family RNA polymerase sigma factor n=1 Tax=Egibacter rhizosphaerae TaxID=1670831 RepID=UPI0013F17728|nr:sigma-70 family RNA polymerase sigma factor [Egibacter rhizosphaerae]